MKEFDRPVIDIEQARTRGGHYRRGGGNGSELQNTRDIHEENFYDNKDSYPLEDEARSPGKRNYTSPDPNRRGEYGDNMTERQSHAYDQRSVLSKKLSRKSIFSVVSYTLLTTILLSISFSFISFSEHT